MYKMEKIFTLVLIPLAMLSLTSATSHAQEANKSASSTKSKPVARTKRPSGSTFVASSGGDINKLVSRVHPKDGVGVFDIKVEKLPKKSAFLTVLAYDIDEERGESTVIFFNDQRVGTLSGTNNSWDSNVFEVSPRIVRKGLNRVRFVVQDRSKRGTINWSLKVGGGQMLIDGGSGESGYITNLSFATKKQRKQANIAVPIQGIKEGLFKLETTIIHPNGNALYSLQEEFKLQENQQISRKQVSDFDPSLPTGKYTIVANLFYFKNEVWIQQGFRKIRAKHRQAATQKDVSSVVSAGNTTESGGTGSSVIQLVTKPIANVIIKLESSDPSEITVSPDQLVFTPENWKKPQTITATGVDDLVHDGDQKVTVKLLPAISDDEAYVGMDPEDISFVNIDDDVSGFIVSPISKEVSEAGTEAEFRVRLRTQPTANVKIPLTVNSPDEARVTVKELIFTPKNWNDEQTVLVKGVDDEISDGAQSAIVLLGFARSKDGNYNNLDPTDVHVTNLDNEGKPALVMTEVRGMTKEDGTTSIFTVKLASKPSAKVNLGLKSSDTKEIKVSPRTLTFSRTDWKKPKTVTITGVDDDVDDGDQKRYVVFTKTTSRDRSYNGLKPKDVVVNNLNDDKAGFQVSSISRNTTEDGSTGIFTVALKTKPTAKVSIGVSSSDPSEAKVSSDRLSFDPSNWNKPKIVTVTGVDDDEHDKDQKLNILLTSASSEDANYQGLKPNDVELTNIDDDTVQVLLTSIGNNTNENGEKSSFRVKLSSKPKGEVKLGISSSNTQEVTLSKSALSFTPQNWDSYQRVDLIGVNDDVDDGDQKVSIQFAAVTSKDLNYNGIKPPEFTVVNEDDDAASLIISNISGQTGEDGKSATFTLRLSTMPKSDTVVSLSSSDASEGTLSDTRIAFNASNWNQEKLVTVTGVNDDYIDGNKQFRIRFAKLESADKNYSGQHPADITVTNRDDDVARVMVSKVSMPTNESGSEADFSIRLTSKPKSNVTIPVRVSDKTELKPLVSSVTFTPANWDKSQTVKVRGIDDDDIDGDKTVTIVLSRALSKDSDYNSINPEDVKVTNIDDDKATMVYTGVTGSTSEDGEKAYFSVTLGSKPKANVSVGVKSSNPKEVSVSKNTLRFTATNWNKPQVITLTGIDDTVDDGDKSVNIILSKATSKDSNYNGVNFDDVSVVNLDDDKAGFNLTSLNGDTSETGDSANFGIRLATKPSSKVTLGVRSGDVKEIKLSKSSLTFTPKNWDQYQTITASGVDDTKIDGDKPTPIIFANAISDDNNYTGLALDPVKVVNIDNEIAQFIITNPTGNTGEDGTAATFKVKLASQPSASVFLGIESANQSEITVSVKGLDFDQSNWDQYQTVKLTGQDDFFDDGNQLTVIRLKAATSKDKFYNTLDPEDLRVFNVDNDFAGIKVSAASRE